jgi:NAD(P)-dependent dehydrogenase (short-subunit alcohol dehydrogenase family)
MVIMSDPFDIADRVAMVTGASQGLGRAFAMTLARRGAKVCLAARSAARLDKVLDDISKAGGAAHAVALDVLDHDSINAAVTEAERHLGAIDILVNNAGVAVQKPFLEQSEADWDAVVDTNLKGAFLVTQSVARGMAERRSGTIINIASMMAHATITQLTPYAASKGGLAQMTRNMALELARYGIRVNAIAPGYIGTEMTDAFFGSPAGLRVISEIPMRRLGATEDLEGPLMLLCSDASRYMTGATVLVDGGFLLR